MAEFLPLCDVLFNVISLAGYFCDVVFDVVMSYALLERGYKKTFAATISIVVTSLLITQVLSLRWYLHVWASQGGTAGRRRAPYAPILLHCLQLGVLWRYARLFVPVDLGHVKHQVRDLCMLRLVHAFCEAAPMLLLQLHVLLAARAETGLEPREEPRATKAFEELNVISASLSLFSVCWALASFGKNVRRRNVHRLVLTWLGVIFQFLWRLGTVSARVCALTLYALAYEYWVFLVIGLHWVSMYLWLLAPRRSGGGGRRPALLAVVHVLAYVNLHAHSPRARMVTFYLVMVVENCVLVGAWAGSGRRDASAAPLAAAALPAFAAGLACMALYYRFFHVRRLGYLLGDNQQGTNSTNASSKDKKGKKLSPADNAAIPGVFNCRFTNPVNGARKKKKPTSFVPPPPPPAPPAPSAAFWRRPLPAAHNHHGGSSENEGSSAGSRVNIQQKLHEKKMKQLAELRVIEEEIKQGKLATTAPVPVEEIYSSLQRQPIPRAKTHAEPPAWPTAPTTALTHPYQNYPVLPAPCAAYPTYTEIKNYPGTYGTNQNVSSELNDPLQLRRLPSNLYVLNDHPTIYENPNINYLNETGFPRKYDMPDKRVTYCDREVSYSGYGRDSYGVNGAYGVVGSEGYGANGAFQERQYKGKLEQLRRMQRCRTPEILLAPHYLEGCKQPCCGWGAPNAYLSRKKEEGGGSSGGESVPDAQVRDTPRPPSDIDSQISLPRSYTLPREFRYWRRRPRVPTALPSNNSSDGDVDSGDEADSSRRSGSAASQPNSPTPRRRRDPRRRYRKPPKPETKL